MPTSLLSSSYSLSNPTRYLGDATLRSSIIQRFSTLPIDAQAITFRELRWSELVSFARTSKAAYACFNEYLLHTQAVLSKKLGYPLNQPFEVKKCIENTAQHSAEIKNSIRELRKQVTYGDFLAQLVKLLAEQKIKDLELYAQYLLRKEVSSELINLKLTANQWKAFLNIPVEHIAGRYFQFLWYCSSDWKGPR